MLKKIVLSVPQEEFPELAMKRGRELAERMGSKLFLSYIIEDAVFDEIFSSAMHVLSEKDRERFERKMIMTHEKVAKKIIFKAARRIMGDEVDEFSVRKGHYTETLLDMIKEHNADTLLVEFDSYNIVRYRMMDSSPVPVWVERHEGPIRRIGVFCTNLSSNDRPLMFAKRIEKAFDARLEPFYIHDPEGKEEHCKSPEMIANEHGIEFAGIENDRADRAIYRISERSDLDLLVVGRMHKKGHFHLSSRFVKRSRCSALLVD